MNHKYFTIEVKPPIDADLLNAAALASDDDVIFSWTPFEIPQGSARLLNVTAKVSSTNGVAQHHPFQLYFAKAKKDVLTNSLYEPLGIGEFNTAMLSQPSINEQLGAVKIEAIDYMCQSLVGSSMASTGNSVAANGANVSMVLTPNTSPGSSYYSTAGRHESVTPGHDVLWVAGVACGAMDFRSTVTTDVGETLSTTATVVHTDTKDANLVFSPGDIIAEEDNTIIGTIVSIGTASTSDVDIVVDRSTGAKQTLADGIKIYHRTPITLELSFER